MPTVVDIKIIWIKFAHSVHFSSLIPKISMFTLAISCMTSLPWFMDLTVHTTNCHCSMCWAFLLLPWLLRWCSAKESACQCKILGFDPWGGKICWSRKWQPTVVFLPGKLHGQRRQATVRGVPKSQTWLSDWVYTHCCYWSSKLHVS